MVAVGAFLDWWRFSMPGQEDFVPNGIDIVPGPGTVVALVVTAFAALLGIVMLVRSGGDIRGWAIASLILTLFPLVFAVYSVIAASDAFVKFAAEEVGAEFAVPEEVARDAIEQGLDQGNIEVSAQLGTYLAAAGSVLMLIGSIMGIARGRRVRRGYTGVAPGEHGTSSPPQQGTPVDRQHYPAPGQQDPALPGQQQYPPQGQTPPGRYPPGSGPAS